MFAIVFALVSISAAAYAVAGTFNNLQFYSALAQLQVTLVSLQWTSSNQSLEGTVGFTVANPAAYRGLGLTALDSVLEIRLSNGSVRIPQGYLPHISTADPLTPGVLYAMSQEFKGAGNAPQQVTDARNRGETVQFVFRVSLSLSTFLDKVSSISAHYQCVSTGGQGNCEQAAVSMFTKRGGSVGAGGEGF